MNHGGFGEALSALRREALDDLSLDDYRHLRKIIWVNRAFFLVGFGTAWMGVNPISMLCISLGLFSQWTMVAHHVCHGGYDKVPGACPRYKSRRFSTGWRRFLDWPDVLFPAAWKYEHNVLHHYYVNEALDPDVPAVRIRHYLPASWSRAFKALFLGMNMCAWKWTYYAPNTLKALDEKKNYNGSTAPTMYRGQALLRCYLPSLSVNFVAIPLLFLPLGWGAVLAVFLNRLGAEFLSNLHTFLTIVPNHVGDDIPLEDDHPSTKEEFYRAQLRGAVNYNTGGFWRDYLQGHLNYQIEHHLFPDLPMSQYAKLQPRVQALCEEHGIEYKQESIFRRIRKTWDILLRSEGLKLPPSFLPTPSVPAHAGPAYNHCEGPSCETTVELSAEPRPTVANSREPHARPDNPASPTHRGDSIPKA